MTSIATDRSASRKVRPGLVWAAVLLALLFPVLTAPPASAHASVVSTDPSDGDILSGAPAVITVTFSEPVGLTGTGTEVLDHLGEPVAVDIALADTRLTFTPTETLPDGSYLVSWRVLSADSHPVAGGLTFAVGAPSETVVAPDDAADDPAAAIVKSILEGLRYLGLLLLVGTALFRFGVLRRTLPTPDRRLGLLGGWTGLLAAATGVLLIGVTRVWQDGLGLGALDDPRNWSDWTGETTAAVLVIAAVLLLGPQSLSRLGTGLYATATALGVVAALTALVVVGHTRVFGPAWLVIGADAIHVLTAAVWMGGVVGLVVALARPHPDTLDDLATVVSRFSALAAWSVLALGVTAGILYWRIADSFSALWTTTYGQLVLVKFGLVLVVLVVAAWNRFRLVPAVRAIEDRPAATRRLRRTTAVEALLLVAVALVTGFLVGQSPRPEAGASAPTGAQTLQIDLDGTAATVVLDPAARGDNTFTLTLVDPDGAPVDPLDKPTLVVSFPERDLGPFPAALSWAGPGRWTGTVELPLAGTWEVRVGVRLTQFTEPLGTAELQIG